MTAMPGSDNEKGRQINTEREEEINEL